MNNINQYPVEEVDYVIKIKNWLEKKLTALFSIQEIEESSALKFLYIVFLISLTATFNSWNGFGFTSPLSGNNCLSHISNCTAYKNIFPLVNQPYGYTESIFYVFLFSIITLTSVALYRKKYLYAHLCLCILFTWKCYIVYGFSGNMGNYDYYDIALLAVFLFSSNKLFFTRIVFIVLYYLSATIKIHEGWILGTYFTSLKDGLPLFGDFVTPIFTNFIITMQIMGGWLLLLPKRNKLFTFAFVEFLLFHLYSGTLVEYRYILTSIPPLLVLFLIPEKISYHPKKNIFGFLLIALMLYGQSIAIAIPGDQKLTLEGNRYGLYMFEANHQCITQSTTTLVSGKEISDSPRVSQQAHRRCDPYTSLIEYQENCKEKEVKSVSLLEDHSINGGPFLRIVNEKNICNLHYNPFKKNSWIRSELDSPEIIGYPVKNVYTGILVDYHQKITTDGSYIILPGLEGNERPTLSSMQQFLKKHINTLVNLYWMLWLLTGVIMITLLLKMLISTKSKGKSEIIL